jgi:3-oxoacyl-[acyl-carrier-protein] synthase II
MRAHTRAQVKDFTAADYFTNKKSARSNDKVTHFAMAAARLAIDDAGIDVAAAGERAGVMVGSAFGGMDTYVRPFDLVTVCSYCSKYCLLDSSRRQRY